jgi:hypothetical protein
MKAKVAKVDLVSNSVQRLFTDALLMISHSESSAELDLVFISESSISYKQSDFSCTYYCLMKHNPKVILRVLSKNLHKPTSSPLLFPKLVDSSPVHAGLRIAK